MKIDKKQILDLLQSRGEQGKASQADQELPGTVDTENQEHRGLLDKLGLNVEDLLGNIGGMGGIGKKLGL